MPDVMSQAERGAAFRSLHDEGIFVMPCVWDAGSARLFARAGFPALGTTSGGVNWSAGRADYVYSTPRHEMLDAYSAIATATSLPVSGDLENGYGDTPEDVATTIRASIAAGLVGGSIEDQSADPAPGLVPLGLAVERISAAREAADASGIDYTLTARAESFFGAVTDPMTDAIERAQRYVEAGADCIFIPGVATLEAIATVVAAIPAPVSVGVGSGGAELTVDALREIGVRRISTGGLVPRAIAAWVERFSHEMSEAGTFTFGAAAMPESEINELHARERGRIPRSGA